MAKRVLLLLSCVFCLQMVFAQSMSDAQIMDFVKTEQEKGTDERAIAAKLFQKGVSPDRIRQIKEKYEREAELFADADEIVEEENQESRSRTEEAAKKTSSAQNPLMEDAGVYGRSIFNNDLLTFELSKNMPTPSDYILGAGDVVIIDVWGASQKFIETAISPDGKIVLNKVGPLHIAGKTVEAANEYLKSVLENVYTESIVNLSLGATRSIVVQVIGEVVTPGNYTLSALSTAFNALYAAGGISTLGTLRSIDVFRNGKSIAKIDVYDYIFNGATTGNIRLQDNDVIRVGTYNTIVNVQGKVKRPMMYELKEDETLASAVKYAGGFTGDAYCEKMRVVRKTGREYSLFTVDRKDMGSFTMHDGDDVYVDSIIPRFSNMVEITGAVFYPGQYQFNDDVNTVSELIAIAGGVREDAFLNRAILHHRNNDKTIVAQSIDVKGILDGTAADVDLRNNDVIFIPSESDMRGEEIVTIRGEVNFPGHYDFAENTTLEDAIIRAGGLTRAASHAKIDVYRQTYKPASMTENDTIVESYSFTIKDGFVMDGEDEFILMPFDEVHVRRSPTFEDIGTVTVGGSVLFPGEYALHSKEVRLSDIVGNAGGLARNAYAKGASLKRRATAVDIAQRKLLHTLSNIEFYENIIENNRSVDYALVDSMLGMRLDNSGLISIAIDLEKAMANPGGNEDIVLRNGDILTIPEYALTIKVQGEVKYPTAINWQKGKKVKYYIEHAGGFRRSAKKNGIYVINMNGSVEQVSRNSKNVEPGCEIVVPRGKVRRSLSAGEIITIGTTTVSLATMIATLLNALGK